MLQLLLEFLSGHLLYFALHLNHTGSFPAPLNAKEEKECLDAMQNGDEKARARLIEHNLRLVAHIIKKYYAGYSDQEDLISIGTIGLIKGINTFDPQRGARLATYAARCIENEILMHFRSQKKTAQDVSMSEPIDTDSEGNPLTLMDIISLEDTIADDLDIKMKSERLHQYIRELPDRRERQILVLRYGLDGSVPLTQRQVAQLLHISRSYVSRIEKRSIERLARRFREPTPR